MTQEQLNKLTQKLMPTRLSKKPPLSLFIREHLREKGEVGEYLYDIHSAWNKFKARISPNYHPTTYDSFRVYINRLKRLGLVMQRFESGREYERWEDKEKRTRFRKSRYRIVGGRINDSGWINPAKTYNKRYGRLAE